MASKKQEKAKIYHQKTKEWDRNFDNLHLERPQDQNPDLLRRNRQLNFGLVHYDENPNKVNIHGFSASPNHWTPKMNFKCYENGQPLPNWVTNRSDLQLLVEKLKLCSEFTIDIEVHNHRTQTDFICLVQIGTWEHGDFLIDPIVLRDDIKSELKPLLEANNILKIGYDITNDVLWLQKDLEIFLSAAADVQIMVELLHGDKPSLKNIALRLHPELNKFFVEETLSDWRLRPGKGMSKSQETYATNDVHVLLRVFDELRNQMFLRDPLGNLFGQAVEKSKLKLGAMSQILKKPPANRDFSVEAANELSRLKSTKTFDRKLISSIEAMDDVSRFIFSSIFEWRDNMAKILDSKPAQVLPSEKLVKLSTLKSPQIQEIKMILGTTDRRISDPKSTRALQAAILQNLITSNGTYIEELRNNECHNCLKKGHGPAWACPFPKNKANYKAYYDKEENRKHREKQYNRRLELLSSKVGAENAKAIFDKNKNKN